MLYSLAVAYCSAVVNGHESLLFLISLIADVAVVPAAVECCCRRQMLMSSSIVLLLLSSL